MIRSVKMLVATFIGILIPLTVHAQESSNTLGLTKYGFNPNISATVSSNTRGSEVVYFLSGGVKALDVFSVELEGFYWNDSDNCKQDCTKGGSDSYDKQVEESHNFGAFTNLLYNATEKSSPVGIYAGGGVGLGYRTHDVTETINGGYSKSFDPLDDESGLRIFYQSKVGVNYNVVKNFKVHAGFRYMNSHDPNNGLSNDNFNFLGVELGARYEF